MGLFDGRSPAQEDGSTAEMAKWLDAPVLLVVDASTMARSAAAVVRGFETFDEGLKLAGVLLNRAGGPSHAAMLRESIAAYCRTRVVGALPCDEEIVMPSRHLGLTMAGETLTEEHLAAMAAWIEPEVGQTIGFRGLPTVGWVGQPIDFRDPPTDRHVRIAIARDAAFCFYYQDNLDLLASFGAELVEFSPMADAELPPGIGGLYLGGGYPELHAAELARNGPMLRAVRRFAESGAPVYAECGGFMYLTEAIVDASGKEHAMAALFPTRARMQPRLAALGYVQPEPVDGALWLRAGEHMRGHQFRYSTIDPMPPSVVRAYAGDVEGYTICSALGSYVHLHFLSCPGFAQRFVEHCARWRSRSK
jgi:cobyrinic acid a,c-diamide synthase